MSILRSDFFWLKNGLKKIIFKFFLIFRKKYDIVYNSYTDVKTHKKSNFNFFFRKKCPF